MHLLCHTGTLPLNISLLLFMSLPLYRIQSHPQASPTPERLDDYAGTGLGGLGGDICHPFSSSVTQFSIPDRCFFSVGLASPRLSESPGGH